MMSLHQGFTFFFHVRTLRSKNISSRSKIGPRTLVWETLHYINLFVSALIVVCSIHFFVC